MQRDSAMESVALTRICYESEINPNVYDHAICHDEKAVFGAGDEIQFRTVSWLEAVVFMVKMTLGLGVLSIPSALYELGAVAGAFFLGFWTLLMAYLSSVIGKFVLRYPYVHTISDACYVAISPFASKRTARVVREIAEFLNVFTWTLTSGALTLSLSIALNAISDHAACSVVFKVVCCLWIASWASIRKIQKLSWFAWIGLVCIISALLIVVIAVSIPARPATAPKIGAFELGFAASPPPSTTFTVAWSSALAISTSFSNITGFVPVIAEMREPRHFFRSVYICMAFVGSLCLSLSLTMYAYTGKWVATPALGSAGGTVKVIAYAVAIPGLTASGAILTHIVAKMVFVRALRGTKHLGSNTKTHWIAWLTCTFGIGALGFILSEIIPFFNQLVSLIGALGFGPLSICVPVLLWLSLHKNDDFRQWSTWLWWTLHFLLLLLGLLVTIGGTYVNVVLIIQQYRNKSVSSPFTCADNSNTA